MTEFMGKTRDAIRVLNSSHITINVNVDVGRVDPQRIARAMQEAGRAVRAGTVSRREAEALLQVSDPKPIIWQAGDRVQHPKDGCKDVWLVAEEGLALVSIERQGFRRIVWGCDLEPADKKQVAELAARALSDM